MTPEQQATAHRKSVEHVHQLIEAEHQLAGWRARLPDCLLRLLVRAQNIPGVMVDTYLTAPGVTVRFRCDTDMLDTVLDYNSQESEFDVVNQLLTRLDNSKNS